MSVERFFDWDDIYKERSYDEMGWYWKELDPDLNDALVSKSISGGTFLDIGTGPGTQAKALHEKGFSVTASDISARAVKMLTSTGNGHIHFVRDDILSTGIKTEFDYIFDRGVFHTFEDKYRMHYAQTIYKLLKAGGLFFLKCFSDKETDSDTGPHRVSKEIIRNTFGKYFVIDSIKETVYQGTRDPFPKAYFVVMKKKSNR